MTHGLQRAAVEGWPALVPGGGRLARSLAVLGLVASSAGCILTKDLPDPALDVPEGYKAARLSKAAGRAADARLVARLPLARADRR